MDGVADSFLIPLAEIERKAGDQIRFAYWGKSAKPDLTVNSVGFETKGGYYSHHLPIGAYHQVSIARHSSSLDAKAVPNGRDAQVALDQKPTKPVPKVGTAPPEISATEWINTDKTPTLADLKGKVVVVEFWAIWCGPRIEGIPHLTNLHDEYGGKELVILGITDQSKSGIEKFMKKTPIKYGIGADGELSAEYGAVGNPHAFVVGRDGKLAWEGHPGTREFDEQVKSALEAK